MEAHCRGSFTIRVFLDACFQSWRLRASSRGRGRDSLLLMEGEAVEMFSGLRIMPVASKRLRTSTSTHRSESVVNK